MTITAEETLALGDAQLAQAQPSVTPRLAGLAARFIGNLLESNRTEIAVTFALSLLSALAQFGLALLLILALRAEEQQLTLGPVELHGGQMWAFIVSVAILAAALPFVTERYVISRTISFFKSSLKRFGTALCDKRLRFALFTAGHTRASLTRLMSADTRYASLAFGGLLRLFLPLFMGLSALAIMAWLNWTWTLIFAAVITPFLVGQLYIVFSGIRLNRQLRSAAVAHGRSVGAFIDAVSTHFTANRWGSDQLHSHFAAKVGHAFPDAYGRRLRLGVSTRVLSDLSLVAALVALVYLLLVEQSDIQTIGYLLIFAILARHAIGSFASAVSGTISIVAQLPFYENYLAVSHFLDSEESRKPVSIAQAAGITPGISVCFSAAHLNWALASHFIMARHGRDVGEAVSTRSNLVQSRYSRLNDVYTHMLQIPPNLSEAHFSRLFPASSHRWEGWQEILEDQDQVLSSETWMDLPPMLKFLSAALYASRKSTSDAYTFVNGADYSALTRPEKAWLHQLFRGTRILIFHARPVNLKHYPARAPILHVNNNGTHTELGMVGDVPESVDIAEVLAKDRHLKAMADLTPSTAGADDLGGLG
ncbi:hypothetical protein AB6B38_07420 [Glycocaulis abyssi]|uniref:ABC transmembrane type-1 domain-containing protein n=1 Tax=Glycocaulis abyssi TaxID=1433403 RepID=A0ABV9NAF9_9PROT